MSVSGYRVADIDGRKSITILHDNNMHVMSDDNPAFNDVCMAVLEKEYDKAVDLCNAEVAVNRAVEEAELTDRIEIKDGVVLFDGEACNDEITRLIVDMARGGDDFVPLANFYARLAENPIHHARNQLFGWLSAVGDFSITPDGFLIGYKGVSSDYSSVHRGSGIVNGIAQDFCDNSPGNTVEVERVEMNPSVGCSYGLHVANWDYARSWGVVVVACKFDPADVVSVPTDCGWQKLRTKKYEVIEQVDAPYTERVVANDYN